MIDYVYYAALHSEYLYFSNADRRPTVTSISSTGQTEEAIASVDKYGSISFFNPYA